MHVSAMVLFFKKGGKNSLYSLSLFQVYLITDWLSYFSIVVIKHHNKATYRRKSLLGT